MANKCPICGGEKSKLVTPKPGQKWEPFYSCPIWDDAHKKAQEERKSKKDYYALPKTYPNASASPQTHLSNNPDVYELLTNIDARTKKILEHLTEALPKEEDF